MADPLIEELTERIGQAVARAAKNGDPLFGTVELTIGELTELLAHIKRLSPTSEQVPIRGVVILCAPNCCRSASGSAVWHPCTGLISAG